MHVARSSFDARTFAATKIQTPVAAEPAVDLAPLVDDQTKGSHITSSSSFSSFSPSSSPSSSSTYRLVGIVNHHGKGMAEGHFTAFGLNRPADAWMLFNDANVTIASEAQALQSQAYLLFYVRDGL